MKRAAAGSGMVDLLTLLVGPSAVAFVSGDPVAAAKTVVDATKLYPTLVLKGAYLDGQVLSADEARALAELDSRDVMLSKIAGLVKNEIGRAAGMFVATQSKFLSVLEAFRQKLPPEPAEETAAETVVPAPTDAADEAPSTDEAPADPDDEGKE
jgi:large subunit ribosomal protein L10